ncbi:MAG TPA: S8 family serine peptidase [Verrucomicrobiae bacterium]|nr:S8 family serine peptidase [Verrucomicrobiae bacterium]
MKLTAAAGGGVSLRVAQPGVVQGAGTKVGAIAQLGRNAQAAMNPHAFLRTYLGDARQEELPLTPTSGFNTTAGSTGVVLFEAETSKPYDTVEFAVESGGMVGDLDISVYETCSKVGADASTPQADGSGHKRAPAAVVADLSTGNNPYHNAFRRPDWKSHPSKFIPGFPTDAPALELTFGADFEANRAADEAKWRSMQTGVTYWIPGTNLLYLRTRTVEEAFPGADDRLPYETNNHGVLTAGTIADACKDCYLLIVSDPQGGFTYSLDFIAQHAPWVDVAASTQQATTITPLGAVEAASGLLLSPLMGPTSPYASAAKRWAEAGKLYFIASGNTPLSATGYPVPLPTSDRTLPPWFTVVGGAYAECRGSERNAGRPTEFASEYVVTVGAVNSMDEYETVSGTSFSTPLVATRFAQALKRVRIALGDTREPGVYWSGTPLNTTYLADGKLTRDELYDAFAKAADLFLADEYTGPCGSNGVAASPQPWLEMGWGYVGPEQAALAADLILGLREASAKSAEHVNYMDTYLGAREATGAVTP